MGIGDAYQDSTDRALTVMAARPIDPEPPKPKHSGWSTIPRAVAGAFVETAGNIMDVASAYGQVQAATGANANPLIPDSPEDRKQRLDAYDKLKTEGINWQPEESRPHYEAARDLSPDPITAGAAENIVFGITKGLTKAITVGTIAGPVIGAGLFGASEGMTTADNLPKQVDQKARTKIGVVAGVGAGIGMLVPASIGASRLISAGVGATVNPVLGATQRALTSKILESADYGEIAKQYDPLDPTMLAIEAGFGALVGGAFFRGKPAPKPAADSAATVKDSLTTEPASHVSTQEQIDAAMVHNLTLARDAHEANATDQVDSMMRVSLEEADRLITNQQRRFDDAKFLEARQAAVDEMNLRDSQFHYQRPPVDQLPTQADIGAPIAFNQARDEALARIANGEQLVVLPDALQTPQSGAPVEHSVSSPAASRYVPPAAMPTSVTKESFTSLASTQTRYQGNKREFFKNNGAVLAKEVAPYTQDVGTVFDMYAGGGTYGLSMVASGAFPNVKRVVINEVDAVRHARLVGAIEKGGRIMDPWHTDPVMIQLAEKLKPLIGKSSTPAAMAMEGKGKYSEYAEWISKNLTTDEQKTARLALHDVMFSGRTATWDRLIKNATEDADRIHALAKQAKDRGASIEVTSLDATGQEAISLVRGAGRSFVVLDPPYHKTSAGTYAAKEATDFGGDVFLHKNMIAAREMSVGNSVVYNNADTPGVRAVAKDVFGGNMAAHGWKRQNGQQEFLGVYHDTATSAGSGRGIRSAGAPSEAGGVLAGDGGYSSRKIDTGSTVGDQAGRVDRSTGQHPELNVGNGGEVVSPSPKDPHIASVIDRAEAIRADAPDLPVAIRDDGSHATFSEELDAIRRQAREGTADTFGADDAPLIQVAVECMLSMGAA